MIDPSCELNYLGARPLAAGAVSAAGSHYATTEVVRPFFAATIYLNKDINVLPIIIFTIITYVTFTFL